jgi:hypothetical protein
VKRPKVNIEKIAKALGAERRGKVRAGSGYFGAMQLVVRRSGTQAGRP